MTSRRTVLFIQILSFALLSAAGCTDAGGRAPTGPAARASAAAPSPTADLARDEFLQALQRTQRASHRYAVRGSLPEGAKVQGTGTFDPRARLLDTAIRITGGKSPSAVQRIVIGKHSYLRDLADKTWVHLDLSRVKPDSLVYVDMSDPTGLVQFSSVIGSVRRTGPHAYAGHFNPDAGFFRPFIPVGAPSVVSFGIPMADFTATTNEQGWVTSITVEIEPVTGSALSTTTTMSNHGAKVTIKAPPKAQVREADDVYYEK
jgi:hypothetical protein